jgi:GGDEF domain-containing protein
LLNPTTTLSIGIAVHQADHSLAQTFGEADSALYEAKRAGRDRVHLHQVVPTPPRPDLRMVQSA